MADPEFPVSEEDLFAAHAALESAHTLQDLGVGSLTWWCIRATCSKHGRIVRFEETVGGPPEWSMLLCIACRQEGLKRSCPIDELERITGKPVPSVGGL